MCNYTSHKVGFIVTFFFLLEEIVFQAQYGGVTESTEELLTWHCEEVQAVFVIMDMENCLLSSQIPHNTLHGNITEAIFFKEIFS